MTLKFGKSHIMHIVSSVFCYQTILHTTVLLLWWIKATSISVSPSFIEIPLPVLFG